MKAEKTISFVAFIYNGLISVWDLFSFLKLSPVFKKAEMQIPFPWHVLVAFAFTIGGLAYWSYLKRKEKKGEEAKLALAISLILLLVPQFIISAIAGFSLTRAFQSAYSNLGNIK